MYNSAVSLDARTDLSPRYDNRLMIELYIILRYTLDTQRVIDKTAHGLNNQSSTSTTPPSALGVGSAFIELEAVLKNNIHLHLFRRSQHS